MSDFSMFMAGNAIKNENVKYVASNRFQVQKKDKDGNPIVLKKDKGGNPVYDMTPVEWEIKSIDSDLDELLRKECTKRVPIAGKRGQYTQETDTDKYTAKMCVACTVYPDLNNAELQDSYGVKGAEDLLKKMLLPGEYIEYKAKVMEVNGYDMSMEELVEDAKN